jgi:hypothetical protein
MMIWNNLWAADNAPLAMAIVDIDDKVHRSIICCMFANGDGKKKLGKKAFLLEPAISRSAFFLQIRLASGE